MKNLKELKEKVYALLKQNSEKVALIIFMILLLLLIIMISLKLVVIFFPLIIVGGILVIVDIIEKKVIDDNGVNDNDNSMQPLSLRDCLLQITREDEISYPSEKAIDKNLSRIAQRFVSCVCTGFEINEEMGVLLIRFSIVHTLNPLSIEDIKNAVFNDILSEYRIIFELYGLSIPPDFEDYVLVDVRKNKLYILIAISNVGLQTIAQRRKVLEKNSTLLRNR